MAIKNQTKVNIILSFVMGVIVVASAYFLLKAFDVSDAFVMAIFFGVFFAYGLSLCMHIITNKMNKRYREAEKLIQWEIICKTNGNFETGKNVRNGNIYFCDEGIVFISLDEKPFAFLGHENKDIDFCEIDGNYMKIYCKSGLVYCLTIPDMPCILGTLQDGKCNFQLKIK